MKNLDVVQIDRTWRAAQGPFSFLSEGARLTATPDGLMRAVDYCLAVEDGWLAEVIA